MGANKVKREAMSYGHPYLAAQKAISLTFESDVEVTPCQRRRPFDHLCARRSQKSAHIYW